VSITNSSLTNLRRFFETFGEKVFAHEVQFNFEIRENEKWGITEYADQNGFLNLVYQPLRRNRTAERNWSLLKRLANKYNKTQNQIIINWLESKGFYMLIKSENRSHIDENLNALNFEMETADFEKLNEFSPPNWETPKVTWKARGSEGDVVAIDQLSNIFDERYDEE
jgi:diketogulonate reductase-like aldo/keto reductase